jgi:uncharacterized membrane protein
MEKHTAESHGGLNATSRKLLQVIAVLSVIAMGVAAYLTYLHYAPEAAEFCNFNDRFNCEIVNKSIYSYIDLGFVEIPVSVLGFKYYVFNLLMVFGLLRGWNFQKIHKSLSVSNMMKILTGLSIFGTIFSGYLTYVEAFILFTYCVFCLASQTLVFLIMVLNFVTMKKLKR